MQTIAQSANTDRPEIHFALGGPKIGFDACGDSNRLTTAAEIVAKSSEEREVITCDRRCISTVWPSATKCVALVPGARRRFRPTKKKVITAPCLANISRTRGCTVDAGRRRTSVRRPEWGSRRQTNAPRQYNSLHNSFARIFLPKLCTLNLCSDAFDEFQFLAAVTPR